MFIVSKFKESTIVSVADGCGWGVAAQTAARNATIAAIDFIKGIHFICWRYISIGKSAVGCCISDPLKIVMEKSNFGSHQ